MSEITKHIKIKKPRIDHDSDELSISIELPVALVESEDGLDWLVEGTRFSIDLSIDSPDQGITLSPDGQNTFNLPFKIESLIATVKATSQDSDLETSIPINIGAEVSKLIKSTIRKGLAKANDEVRNHQKRALKAESRANTAESRANAIDRSESFKAAISSVINELNRHYLTYSKDDIHNKLLLLKSFYFAYLGDKLDYKYILRERELLNLLKSLNPAIIIMFKRSFSEIAQFSEVLEEAINSNLQIFIEHVETFSFGYEDEWMKEKLIRCARNHPEDVFKRASHFKSDWRKNLLMEAASCDKEVDVPLVIRYFGVYKDLPSADVKVIIGRRYSSPSMRNIRSKHQLLAKLRAMDIDYIDEIEKYL